MTAKKKSTEAKRGAVKSRAKKANAKKSSAKKRSTKKLAQKSAAKKSVRKKTSPKKSVAIAPASPPRRTSTLRAKAFGVQPSTIPAAPLADPPIGFTKILADKLGDGFGTTSLRADLKSEYNDAMATIKALGGVLTSSGAVRELSAEASAGRSQTSFHYTGRAFDVWIGTGMQSTKDRYLVQQNGGTDANPEWEILCISETPDESSPLFDASLIETREVEFIVWKKGPGITLQKRTVKCFSLTFVLKKFGWVNIPARTGWKTEYLSCEWWHFQHHKGLIEGKSLFGDELCAVWKSAAVAKSGLALNAVFKGRSFRIP
jgi:hypothetical protein